MLRTLILLALLLLVTTAGGPGERPGSWDDLGHGLAGEAGTPLLVGSGELLGGDEVRLTLSGAAPRAPTWILIGFGVGYWPLKGGELVPEAITQINGLSTDAEGRLELVARWPAELDNVIVYLQAWVADPTGPQGYTASNGLAADAP